MSFDMVYISIIYVLILLPSLSAPSYVVQQEAKFDDVITVGDVSFAVASEPDIERFQKTVLAWRDAPPAIRAGILYRLTEHLHRPAPLGLESGERPEELAKLNFWNRRDLRALWALRRLTGLALPGPDPQQRLPGEASPDAPWRADSAQMVEAYSKGVADAYQHTAEHREITLNDDLARRILRLRNDQETMIEAAALLYNALLSQQPLGKSATALLEKVPPAGREAGRAYYSFDGGFGGTRITILLGEEEIVRGITVP